MNKPTDNFDAALQLAKNGYVPVAMLPGLKVPAERGWQGWMDRAVTEGSIAERWRGTRNGIGILCKDIVVFDVDAQGDDLLRLVLERCALRPERTPICRTPRGGYHVHARFRRGVDLRSKIKLGGQELDVLTGPRLSILPPHTNEEGVPYEWLTQGLPPILELPLANVGWTRERTRRRLARNVAPFAGDDSMVRRAWSWVACVEGAVSGQAGHNRTFRVCCKLTHPPPRGFGLCFAQAWPILLAWNEACEPPWTEKELTHKLEDALKKA
jgi:hypothetical protein